MTAQESMRDIRQSLGLTQEQFARYMDLTVRTVARYENEVPPRGQTLMRFAKLAKEQGREDAFNALLAEHFEQFGKDVESAGLGRIAFHGALRQWFLDEIEALEDALGKDDDPTPVFTEDQALAALDRSRKYLNWPRLEAMKQMISEFERIGKYSNPILHQYKDPVGTLKLARECLASARRKLDITLPFCEIPESKVQEGTQ